MMRLDGLRPLIKLLPEVKSPVRAPVLNERLMWTAIALLMFFVMYHIYPVGVIEPKGGSFEFLQMIMASKLGSLITAGIGPIVLASIFLQLFVGAKVLDIDFSNQSDKVLFSGTQKLLALVLCIFEAAVYILSGSIQVFGSPGITIAPLLGSILFTQAIVILQLAFGSIILLYLDEVVSKHGIGSGVSLFIAAGVSLAVFQGTIALITGWGLPDPSKSALAALSGGGGANAIPNALMALLPLFFTVVVFLVVTYAEGMRVEIPLSIARFSGYGSRYPIKFLYVSNIPVILASALILNIQMWARAFIGKTFMLGGVDIVKYIAVVNPATGRLEDGFLYFISPLYINPISIGYDAYISILRGATASGIPEFVHVIVYVITMVILCVIFGKFWIETTPNMSAKDVARQIQMSGMQVPGFRRDPRIIEALLDKYIPTITVLGSIFVGLLASFADLTGALGTGTGILLTVGILHKMYEELSAQRVFDIYPQARKFFG
jgi:preprotein translocase subunit SecY